VDALTRGQMCGTTTCHNCGNVKDGAARRCSRCGCLIAASLRVGDAVEWSGNRGGRVMSGVVVAVIPEYASAMSVLAGSGIMISARSVALRERPYRSYVVEAVATDVKPWARYTMPSPFALRKTGGRYG
jgi:hypothetical protein